VDPRLKNLKRLALAGPANYSELPGVANRTAVLVMPYADLPVTRAMQPLKLKEYLATGLPVVAARLPATEAWSEACDLVGSAEEFAERVQSRLGGPPPASQLQARRRLERESWRAKAREFAGLWGEELR
jgi:glycosyltransferase involved in cell wall biosynthesis